MDKRFIKKLMAQVKCGICGEHYRVSNIKVLGHQNELWFLHVLCRSCYTQGVVAIAVKEGDTVQIVTDLTEPECARFKGSKVIDVDDVLDMHSYLKNFDGDFIYLFNEG